MQFRSRLRCEKDLKLLVGELLGIKFEKGENTKTKQEGKDSVPLPFRVILKLLLDESTTKRVTVIFFVVLNFQSHLVIQGCCWIAGENTFLIR